MSRSTTGAYGDFPSYYYENGNLFGSYLKGHTPGQSWDVRTEVERLGSSNADSRASTKRVTRRPRATRFEPLTKVGDFVQSNLAPDAAAWLLRVLRGSSPAGGEDPYEQLDLWVAEQCWTEKQQQLMLTRLELALLEAERSREPGRGQRRSATRQAAKKNRSKKEARPVAQRSRPRSEFGPASRVCSLCSADLSEAERSRSARLRSIFLGQAYCTEHADKFEALLSGGKTT